MIQVTPEHFLSLLLAGLTTGDEHRVSCPGPWVIESLKESFIFKKKNLLGEFWICHGWKEDYQQP